MFPTGDRQDLERIVAANCSHLQNGAIPGTTCHRGEVQVTNCPTHALLGQINRLVFGRYLSETLWASETDPSCYAVEVSDAWAD